MSVYVPTPWIVPYRLPVIGQSKIIDIDTRLLILCRTSIPDIDVFFTIDGTKPQPYIKIVQGSKTYKYSGPFTVPAGTITVKAIAVNSRHHDMHSSVITKTFKVRNIIRQNKTRNNISKSTICSASVDKRLQANDSEPNPNSFMQASADSLFSIHKEGHLINDDLFLDFSSDRQDTNTSAVLEESTNLVAKISLSDQEGLSTETKENVDLQEIDEALQYLKECVTAPEPTDKTCMDCKDNLLLKYCERCGRKLFKVCANCRTKNILIAHFCHQCGKEFSQEKGEAFEVEGKAKRSVGILVKPHTSTNSWSNVSRSRHVRSHTVTLRKSEIFDVQDLPDASRHYRHRK